MSGAPVVATNKQDGQALRLLTHLHPGLPLGLFQTYQYYLEEMLGYRCYLSVESRWSAPPSERTDPFTADEADIGIIITDIQGLCQRFATLYELFCSLPYAICPLAGLLASAAYCSILFPRVPVAAACLIKHVAAVQQKQKYICKSVKALIEYIARRAHEQFRVAEWQHSDSL